MNRNESNDTRTQRVNVAKKRDLISFWILGLCNNYGYVVMLTAASDIINSGNKTFSESSGRWCTPMSTGAILLADVVPSFTIKILSPFLPYNANLRVLISCLLTVTSFLLVAFATSQSVVILGVILTSFASGLGEPTFLAHSTHFHKNVVSTWSSGTGGAGIIGALSYSLMREIGLNSQQTLVLMLFVPTVEFFAFFFLLSKPTNSVQLAANNENESLLESVSNESVTEAPLETLAQKLAYIPELMIYFVPLSLVYFFEYFINQGLFELITFFNTSLYPAQQYRWYQVTYQIGVFVSRSSVNLIQIKRTYIMAYIQCFLALLFLTEAVFLFIPNISIIFALIFIEGLQGGLAYVNTYNNISRDVPSSRKQFAMNIVASSDSIGIIFAGLLAIPTHNWICQMPGMVNI